MFSIQIDSKEILCKLQSYCQDHYYYEHQFVNSGRCRIELSLTDCSYNYEASNLLLYQHFMHQIQDLILFHFLKFLKLSSPIFFVTLGFHYPKSMFYVSYLTSNYELLREMRSIGVS